MMKDERLLQDQDQDSKQGLQKNEQGFARRKGPKLRSKTKTKGRKPKIVKKNSQDKG